MDESLELFSNIKTFPRIKNTENQEETTICFNFQHTTFNPIINRTNKADIITFKRETTNNA